MVTLVTNKRRIVIESPTQWEDVTTGMFPKIVLAGDFFSRLSVMYGVEKDLLESLADEKVIEELMRMSKFSSEELSTDLPTHFKFREQLFMMPKNLDKFTFGQVVSVINELQRRESYEECISFVVAVFVSTHLNKTGAFDLLDARDIESEINEIPITVTYPIGFFYLSKLRYFGTTSSNVLTRLKVQVMNWMRRLLSLLELKS